MRGDNGVQDAFSLNEWHDIESDAWDVVSQFPVEGTVPMVCNELEERYGIRRETSEKRLLAAICQETVDMLAEKRISNRYRSRGAR